MKIGIIGDTHFTNQSPDKRKDNYFETQLGKFEEALAIFDGYHCNIIIQVGDFFDTSTVANRVKSAVISLLGKYNRCICCVAGQHDIIGHSMGTYANSPLAVLEAADVVTLLNKNEYIIEDNNYGEGKNKVVLYGASFGEDIPEVDDVNNFNILVIHDMIGERELYPGQVLKNPVNFLRQHTGFDLVCSGDYHYRFIQQFDGRTILNPGCMVRKTVSEFDLKHEPAVIVFNTEKNECEVIKLTVRPVEDVFDLKKIEVKDNSKVLDFIENLRKSGKNKSSWKEILVQVLREKKYNDTRVSQIIDECLLKVKK
jgi:predicted phosphodiesterase